MVALNKDYRTVLREELEQRSRKNPRYSLRSFAKYLGVSPSALSEVLSGHYHLSPKAARRIVERLGYDPTESEIFCALVEREQAKSPARRKVAEIHLEQIQSRETFHTIQMDAFHVIADWHHFAILELTYLEGFQSTPAWIAKQLGISSVSARASIDRLKRLDLLEERGGVLKATEDFTASTSGVPSHALRKFHTQLLEKAMSSIEEQSVEERDLSSMVMAIDPRDIPKVKEKLKVFRRTLASELNSSNSKRAVYCLATQFFRLNESRTSEQLNVSEQRSDSK